MTIPAPSDAGQTTQGYMQIAIGVLNLLVPMEQVVSLESVLDIERDESAPGHLGQIKVSGAGRPVFNLGEDLRLVSGCMDARKICVCLGNDEYGYGIVCDQITKVMGSELELVALPSCMKTENNPVHALAIKDKQVMSVTTASALRKLIHLHATGATG